MWHCAETLRVILDHVLLNVFKVYLSIALRPHWRILRQMNVCVIQKWLDWSTWFLKPCSDCRPKSNFVHIWLESDLDDWLSIQGIANVHIPFECPEVLFCLTEYVLVSMAMPLHCYAYAENNNNNSNTVCKTDVLSWWYMVKLFEQCFLVTFPLRMGNKCLSGYFRLVVGPLSHLLPVDSSTAQSCLTTLLKKLAYVSSALRYDNMLQSRWILFHLMRQRQKPINLECASLFRDVVSIGFKTQRVAYNSSIMYFSPWLALNNNTSLFLQRRSVCFHQNPLMFLCLTWRENVKKYKLNPIWLVRLQWIFRNAIRIGFKPHLNVAQTDFQK